MPWGGREKNAYFLLESGVFCLRPTFIRGWRRFQNGFYDIRRLASGRGFETPPRKGLFFDDSACLVITLGFFLILVVLGAARFSS